MLRLHFHAMPLGGLRQSRRRRANESGATAGPLLHSPRRSVWRRRRGGYGPSRGRSSCVASIAARYGPSFSQRLGWAPPKRSLRSRQPRASRSPPATPLRGPAHRSTSPRPPICLSPQATFSRSSTSVSKARRPRPVDRGTRPESSAPVRAARVSSPFRRAVRRRLGRSSRASPSRAATTSRGSRRPSRSHGPRLRLPRRRRHRPRQPPRPSPRPRLPLPRRAGEATCRLWGQQPRRPTTQAQCCQPAPMMNSAAPSAS